MFKHKNKKKGKSAEEKGKKGDSKSKKNKSCTKCPIKGVSFLLMAIFVCSVVAVLLFNKLTTPDSIAKIMPANNTIGIMEAIIDINHSQPQKFLELLSGHKSYLPENITALFNQLTPFDFNTEIKPWLGRKIAIALYDTSSRQENRPLSMLAFIETNDPTLTLSTIQKRAPSLGEQAIKKTDYNNYTIYEFSLSYNQAFSFIDRYLVIADTPETLKQYIEEYSTNNEKLKQNPDYKKTSNNLPRGSLIFGYINYEKLFDTLDKDSGFISKKGKDMLAFRPFLDLFKAEGLSIFADNEKFSAQTFTVLNKEKLDGSTFITYSEKYPGRLLSLVGPDPVLLGAGHDLTKEITRIEEIFRSGTNSPAQIFEGLIEAQKQKYFGKSIRLKEDIYPLLQKEYLFSVDNSLEKPVFNLLIELGQPEKDKRILDKIAEAFFNTGGIFSPKIVEVELPDGTIGKEIIASPETISRKSFIHNDTEIIAFQLGETGMSIYFSFIDDIFIISGNEDSIKSIVDRAKTDNNTTTDNFTSTDYYRKQVKPILRTADEVMHIKVGAVTEWLGLNDDPNLSPYLLPFTNMTVTKNYFEDGISTIYLLEVL